VYVTKTGPSECGTSRVLFHRKVKSKLWTVATLTRTVKVGKTAVTLIGCVGGKVRVPKAAITLRVTATDAAKNVSTPELLAVKNV
jgi:putative transposon-encoded protein